jgi:hypothetical protein
VTQAEKEILRALIFFLLLTSGCRFSLGFLSPRFRAFLVLAAAAISA